MVQRGAGLDQPTPRARAGDEGLHSTRMPQSAAMNPIRATGAAGSSGTYAAPAFIAPYRRDDGLERLLGVDADPVAPAHAGGDQQAGQPPGGGVELAVGERAVAVDDRHRVGIAPGRSPHQVVEQARFHDQPAGSVRSNHSPTSGTRWSCTGSVR